MDPTPAWNCLRRGDLEQAYQMAEQEIARVSDQGDTPELWRLRFIRADVMRIRGKIEPALHYLEAYTPPPREDVASFAGLKRQRGHYLGLLGRYGPSQDMMHEAELLATKAGLLDLLAGTHVCQGLILFRLDDFAASEERFRRVISLGEQLDDPYIRANGLWGVGKNRMIQTYYREAIPWLEGSLEIAEQIGARLLVATVWGELAVCYLGLGDDAKSLELLENAAKLEIEIGAMQAYQASIANIGNVYLHRGDHLTAIEYYRRAVTIAREIKEPWSVRRWTYNINLAYARVRQTVDLKPDAVMFS